MGLIDINKNPSPKEIRWFGALLAAFFGCLGIVASKRFGAESAAKLLWLCGAGFGVVYYAVPPLRRPLYLGWIHAAFPIGWVVSHTVLAASYYLVLAPVGLVMRLLGRDPMARRLTPDSTTYWQPHQQPTDKSRYFKQF